MRSPLNISRMLTGAVQIAVMGWCKAQDPLFAGVDPVFGAGPGPGIGNPFPALRDMRSGWGDIDGDGDFDVIVMGEGPSGPVTKLYRKVDRAESAFAFEELVTTLPQLRGGALAWGDLDNDGDLDLAMSGWLPPTPTDFTLDDFANLRFRIYLNDGPGAAGTWLFRSYATGPSFSPCFGYRVVWFRDPEGTAPEPAVIPGFSNRLDNDAADQIAVQIPADILNTGSQQWLGSVFDTSFMPFFRVLSGGVDSLTDAAVTHLALTARCGGVLDAVDMDRDDRLDLLHSGYDGLLSGANGELEPETKFYRGTGPPNTRPSPPSAASLIAEATPFGVHFRWDAGADSLTPPEALCYALKLRNAAGTYYIRPGATDAGLRLTPGLHGTLQTTHYHFDAANAGRGRNLPDGTYDWSVHSVDSAGAGSVFAADQTFVLSAGQQTDNEETGLTYRDMAVDTGDVDNDGDLDVILAGGSNAVSWPHGDSTVLSRYLGGKWI